MDSNNQQDKTTENNNIENKDNKLIDNINNNNIENNIKDNNINDNNIKDNNTKDNNIKDNNIKDDLNKQKENKEGNELTEDKTGEKNNLNGNNELENIKDNNNINLEKNENNIKSEEETKKENISVKNEENAEIKDDKPSVSTNKDQLKNEKNYYVYFIASFKINKKLKFCLPAEYGELLEKIENKTNLKYKHGKEELLPEMYRFKINPSFIQKNKKVDVKIENEDNKSINNYTINIIDTDKDLYIYNFGAKTEDIIPLNYDKEYEKYALTIKKNNIEKTNKEYSDFIYSTQIIIEKNKYNFLFYILVFLETYATKFAEKQLELFNLENITFNHISEKHLIKINNIFNTLIKSPNQIYIEKERENNERKKVTEIFFSIVLIFYIKYQINKIEDLFEYKDNQDLLYWKFINYLNEKTIDYFLLSKNHLINLLEKCENENQIRNILFFNGKNIIEFLHNLNEVKDKIKNILENKKIKMIINIKEEYKEPEKDDNIKLLLTEIVNLNETSDLNLIKISPSIIEKYIEYNKNSIKNLVFIYQIINILDKVYKFENEKCSQLINEYLNQNLNLIKTKEKTEQIPNYSEEIVDSIHYTDKNDKILQKILMEKLEKILDFETVKNIYNDLTIRYKDLTEDTLKLVFNYLVKDTNLKSDSLIEIIKKFDNIREYALFNIDNKFLINKDKLLDLEDENEEQNYNLLKILNDEKIFQNNKFSKAPYIRQTCENIDFIKKILESYNFNYNELNKIFEDTNKEKKLYNRILILYLSDKAKMDIFFNNIKLEYNKINEKIKDLEAIKKYFESFFNGNRNNDISEIDKIIQNINDNKLDYIITEGKEQIEKYLKYSNEAKDILNKNKSKLFKLIYEDKKLSIKEEDKILKETLNEFNNFSKLFQGKAIFDIDEKVIKFCCKNIKKEDLNEEINVLNEIFNENKKIENENIINELLLISKRKYIFKTICGIKSFIDILEAKKTNYIEKINIILLKDGNRIDNNVNIIAKYINDLKKLNIDINDNKNNEYIKILIKLSKEPEIILSLFEINKNNIIENLNEENKNKIEEIMKCCEFIKKLGNRENLKNLEDKNLIELFQNKVNENKGILNSFKDLIKNNKLYKSFHNFSQSIFKDLILPKEVIYKLLEKSNNFDEILNFLFYIGKDFILFLDVINKKANIILKNIGEKDKNYIIEIEKYVIPQKNDDLNEINKQIKLLDENKIKDYIKFTPLLFEKYDEININLLNTIVDSLKSNDNKNNWDKLVHTSILKLVQNNKLKNVELLDMVQKDNIYYENKYNNKDLRSLDILNGIDVESLNNDFFDKWNNMHFEKCFKNNLDQFYTRIVLLIKNIKDFQLLFSFFSFENNAYNNHIKSRFEELLKTEKENINPDYLVDLIHFTDKNNIKLKKFIMETIQRDLDSKLIKEIYIKLEKQDLSEECKDLIAKYLTKEQKIDNFIALLKECKNIKKNILNNIDNKFIIHEDKILDVDNNSENENYTLLKEIIENHFLEEKIINNEILYIKLTNYTINKIKSDIEKFNINFNNLNQIIDNKKENNLLERFTCVYLLDKEKAEEKYNDLIKKLNEIENKIAELQIISEYLKTFFNNIHHKDINELNIIIKSLKEKNLNYSDKIDTKKFQKYYNKDKDIFYKNNSIFFKLIYEKNKLIIKEEDKLLEESLKEYKTLEKLFQTNKIFEIDEKMLKFSTDKFKNNYKYNDLINEINILNKVFNNNKNIKNQEIINEIELYLKKNYLFHAVLGIIEFFKNIGAKKSEYFISLSNILLNEEKKDIHILQKCFDDLKTLNIDISNNDNNEYIDILILLIDKSDIINFLFEINRNKIINPININEDNEKEINHIVNCCELFENLGVLQELKNKNDKELIELFEEKSKEKKGIINDFKKLIDSDYLYDCIINYRNNIFNNFIFPKDLVYKLLEKSKNFSDILNLLCYLDKDTILFFNVINEKKDIILKSINENKNENNIIEIKNYINPKKEDNLNTLKEIINSLGNSQIKKYIKYDPQIFNTYIKEENQKNINIINDIVNSLKREDNINESDQFIQNNILKLVKGGKLKDKNLLDTVKKYSIFNNEKYKKNLSLDILNGIEISSLDKNNFNDWKNIYKYKKEEFYAKIVSLIKNFEDFKILFSLNTNKNEILKNYLDNKFKLLIPGYIKTKNEDIIVESINFTDKNDNNLKKYLIDKIQKEINFDTKNNIYIKLVMKYNRLSNDIKQVAATHLTQGKNWNEIYLIQILKNCKNIKKEFLSNIDEKLDIKEQNFLKLDNIKENNDYNILKKLISCREIISFDEIKKTSIIIDKIKNKINNYDFNYNDLDEIFQDENKILQLKDRFLCIYFLKDDDSKNNFEKLKDKYKEIKEIIKELELILKLNKYYKESCPQKQIDEIIRLLKENNLNYFENKIENKQYKDYNKFITISKNRDLKNKSESEIFNKIYSDNKSKIIEEENSLNQALNTFDNYQKLFSPGAIKEIDRNILEYFKDYQDKKDVNSLKNEINILNKCFNNNNNIDINTIINDIFAVFKKEKIIKCTIIGIIFLLSILFLFLIRKYIFNSDEGKENELNEINWNIFNITKDFAKSEENKNNFIELPSQKEKKFPKNKEKLIIGIDFGTIDLRYSYNILENDKIIFIGKGPNEIQTNRLTNKGEKYATKASISLENYGKNELNKINFIKGIKSLFSLDEFNNDNLCYVYPREYVSNFNIKDIIKEYFIMLQRDILENINSKTINNNMIKWIISIPQSWNEFKKQIIYNAAIEAGMNNINLIYDNEAASLAMLSDKYIDDKLKNKGNTFMLIDSGGYYTNITINEIVNNNIIKEKIKINNHLLSNIGIITISEEIIKVLEDSFGKYYFDILKKEKPGQWIKILKDINKIITDTYKKEGIEEFEIKADFKGKGQYEYSYKTEKGINKYIIKYNQYSIIFPAGLSGNIIYKNVQEIINNANNIINELKSNKIKIDSIIVTGGLSKNQIFQDEIKTIFNNKIPIKYLSSYENVISKGAVIYGTSPDKIKSRISPATIGIRKKGDNNDNIEILIKKGEIFENYSITKFIKSTMKDQEIIQLNIYISEKDDKLIENDFMGRLLLYIKKDYSGIIQLNINYDTVLNFYAIDYNNQREIKTKFEFFK